MNVIEEALWMRPECGCSGREVARPCGLFGGGGEPAAAAHGGGRRGGPLPADADAEELRERLYRRLTGGCRAAQDFTAMHKQLSARKTPTPQQLWRVPRGAPRGVWAHQD